MLIATTYCITCCNPVWQGPLSTVTTVGHPSTSDSDSKVSQWDPEVINTRAYCVSAQNWASETHPPLTHHFERIRPALYCNTTGVCVYVYVTLRCVCVKARNRLWNVVNFITLFAFFAVIRANKIDVII